jgi:hypothetical protein
MSFGSITVESCKADTNQNIVGRTPPPPTLTPQMHLPPDHRQDTGQTRVSANQRGGARDNTIIHMFAAKLQIATFFTCLITSVAEVANRM